jgi:hypothetical protein
MNLRRKLLRDDAAGVPESPPGEAIRLTWRHATSLPICPGQGDGAHMADSILDLSATKAGVHCNVVGREERGIYNPSAMTLDAIATALHTSMVELLRNA